MEIRKGVAQDAERISTLIRTSIQLALPKNEETTQLLYNLHSPKKIIELFDKQEFWLFEWGDELLWVNSYTYSDLFIFEKWYGIPNRQGRVAATIALWWAEKCFYNSPQPEFYARLLASASEFCDRYPWSGNWSISEPYWYDDRKIVEGKVLRLKVVDCKIIK